MLAIPYLWVDNLCIVQANPEDSNRFDRSDSFSWFKDLLIDHNLSSSVSRSDVMELWYRVGKGNSEITCNLTYEEDILPAFKERASRFGWMLGYNSEAGLRPEDMVGGFT
jgi:hypothetical protein